MQSDYVRTVTVKRNKSSKNTGDGVRSHSLQDLLLTNESLIEGITRQLSLLESNKLDINNSAFDLSLITADIMGTNESLFYLASARDKLASVQGFEDDGSCHLCQLSVQYRSGEPRLVSEISDRGKKADDQTTSTSFLDGIAELAFNLQLPQQELFNIYTGQSYGIEAAFSAMIASMTPDNRDTIELLEMMSEKRGKTSPLGSFDLVDTNTFSRPESVSIQYSRAQKKKKKPKGPVIKRTKSSGKGDK